MEIAISVAAKVAEYIVAPIGRQIGYVFFYKSHVEKLKVQLRNLEATKDTLQSSVEAAERNGEEIFNNVKNWLEKVDGAIGGAKQSEDIEGHARVGCSHGSFPNPWKTHRLSRIATKMAKEISEVLAEGKFDNNIAYRPTLPGAIHPSARDYVALDSRTSILNEIMEAIKDPNIDKIGVYGMGGVGKTTLVKELEWRAEQDAWFGVVVKATITNSPNVKKIQGQLADGLGLKFEEETEDGRARRLRDRIRKVNNILVILDDIWAKLDLTEIGIPLGDDEHKRCKLLLISRDLNVLNGEMGAQKEFKLEGLTDAESWILFKKMAGDVVEDANIKPIALKVANSCGGLPLLIVTVASALKKKDLSIWRDALKKLTKFDHEGLGSKVYHAIELSYNHLESDELKSFFLFIVSLANGRITHDLLLYSWGLGLFKHVDTLADARDRIYKLTTDLRACCLLLEGTRDLVRMHDVVQEVASSIASKVQPFFTFPFQGELTEWPEKDTLQKYHSIYLAWCHFNVLPENLECPELKLLCLNSEDNFMKVSDDFFVGMRELKVLDFGGFNCHPSPPSSLCHLTNLRALYLCKSMLEDISIVAKLIKLEILSLDRSEIKQLPLELAQLTRLRLLDLDSCSGLTIIPANIISRLTCMEELYMGNCYIKWEANGSKSQSCNASLNELSQLHNLTSLNLQTQDASILPRDLFIFSKLERYKISIGCGWKWSWIETKSYETSRTLMLNSGMTSNIHLDRGIKLLFNSVQELYLTKLKDVTNVLYQLNGEGFPQLKHLHIQDSETIEYIIDSTDRWVNSLQAFPTLECLVLHNLISMKKISNGMLPVQLFNKLKVIKVRGCDKLENLLLHSMIKDLSQLVEVEISECKSMTEIILYQEEEDSNRIEEIKFPKLSSLTIDCVSMLVSFYCRRLPAVMKSRHALFDDKRIAFPNLVSLKISSVNLKKIWGDQLLAHACIQNLTSLTIDNCSSLEYLFPSNVAKGFVSLHHLKISRCGMLKEIFVLEEKMGSFSSAAKALPSDEAIFPSLEILAISHMDSLKSLWNNQLGPNSLSKLANMEISFCKLLLKVFPCYELNNLHNLKSLLVTDCSALEVVFEIQGLNTESVSLGMLGAQLKTLTLERLPALKHIWSKDPDGSLRFQNLCTVKASECESLNHVFPLSLAEELQKLQVLDIGNCGVKNIVANDEMNETAARFVLSQLESLTFWSLAELESFYPGIHTLNCPNLTNLDVYHCDKLHVFTFKSQNCQEDVPLDRQPLFLFEKVTLNTEELSLSSENVTAMCNDDFCTVGQISIRSLQLRCFHDESDKVPWAFLERFINLENLSLECSSFIEIFSGEHTQRTITLRSLKLQNLWNLEYLCQENSEIRPILQNIEILEVFNCPRLTNIVPSSVVFQNLDTLNVQGCSGLISTIALSTARTFMKIRNLYIYDCEMIEEIVASEDGDAGEVAFMKLERLGLLNLPRLKSFCKGNNRFRCPLLRVIFVIECPMMETFCMGNLSTPNLRAVHVTWQGDVWRWEGDVNATIKTLFNETRMRKQIN